MTDQKLSSRFEEEIIKSFEVPKIRTEFVDQLRNKLNLDSSFSSQKIRSPLRLRPAWVLTFVLITIMILGTLVIGPQRVYAAIQRLFGYIPGFGIVDENSPLRILEKPVSITREGITISVNQALLTEDKTKLSYGISGVPLSAYPEGEAVTGCIEMEYLRFPDGSSQEISKPIPADINEVTFILPCIFNTLPGTVPVNWEIPLRFIPLPPDVTVMPVVEMTPEANAETSPTESAPEKGIDSEDTTINAVSVERYIETQEGYIIIGTFRPTQVEVGSWVQVTGGPLIKDAEGKKVTFTYTDDIELTYGDTMNQGGFPWAYKFKAENLAFPLTVSFSGVTISPVDPTATAEVEFDAGTDPQPGQEWVLNKVFQLAGHSLRLISVTAGGDDGYYFRIDRGESLSGVSVQIEGYEPNGGGGGGGTSGGEFTNSLIYFELPKGKLTLVFSNPLAVGPSQTWKGEWSPDSVFTAVPSSDEKSSSVCLDANSYQSIKDLPAGLDGWMVLTQINPDQQIVLSSFDGKSTRVLAPQGSRGALSLDEQQIAYPGADGINIVKIENGLSTILKNVSGYDLHWSPDGKQIAYINSGGSFGVFAVNTEGTDMRKFSNLGYESIAGWSPDGKELYFAIPGSSGTGWLLRAAKIESGEVRDLFILKDSSRKAPMPAVSPDGKRIAYRAVDNNSLYLMSMDGKEQRLVMDQPDVTINGIAWDKESHLLGVSLITDDKREGEVILLQFDNCEAYRINGLQGELEGIIIP